LRRVSQLLLQISRLLYLGLVDKSFQSYSSFFILKGKALPGIVVRRIKDLLKHNIT
jgi:hypothetical protein